MGTWIVVAVTCLAAALGVLGGPGLFGNLDEGALSAPGEAADGLAILEDTADGSTFVAVTLTGLDDLGAVGVQISPLVADAVADVSEIEGVEGVVDPFALPESDPRRAALTAIEGDGVVVNARIRADAPPGTSEAVQARLTALTTDVSSVVPGAGGYVGGGLLVFDEITGQVEEDLQTGELIALPVSLVVMIVVFGGFLAAGIPILGALASIAGALACLYGFTYVSAVDSSVVTVVSVLGLGLCIDYGLLIVSRYREELRAGGTATSGEAERDRLAAALAATMASAGRTVAYSGVTVALSLAGLLVFDAAILRAMGAAGLSIVVVALLVALTLVPGLLALGGSALDRPGALMRLPVVGGLARRLGDVASDEGAFSRLARRVQRRPIVVTVVVAAALAALALPAAGLNVRASGIGLLPVDNEQRQFFDTLAADYPLLVEPGVTVVVPVDGAGDAGASPSNAEITDWAQGLLALPAVESIDPPEPRGSDHVSVGIRLAVDDAIGAAARQAVGDVRAMTPDAGFTTYVTGDAAVLVDLVDSIEADAPVAVAIVVLATLVLLFLMTGSVLIPIKALVMNVLSLGASLGVLVLVFQDGRFENLLGFTSNGGIEVIIAPLVLAFGFGLSMDYEVFLLSRIKEFHDRGMSSDEAVVLGLQRSGRIITSAALILVIVFAGFAAGQLLVVKQIGVALAVAIAVDATLVRILLVPATMTLLREWNWWAPPVLRRLHTRFGVSEGG